MIFQIVVLNQYFSQDTIRIQPSACAHGTTGTRTVGNPVENITGTITVVLKLYGHIGSGTVQGTFRLNDFILNGFTRNITDTGIVGPQWVGKNSYRYGFNGKEKDNEDYGEGNAYDFGARIQDPRLGRFLSIDPVASKFPDLSPYAGFNNNPIRFIDADGQAASDPPFWIWFRETNFYGNFMMTNGAFQRAAEHFGVPSTSPYLPRLGRIFEDAVLRSAEKVNMKKSIYPYPVTSPNTYFIPDAIEDHLHTIGKEGYAWGKPDKIYNFGDAIITDAKFTTESKVSLTDQITGFIDYLSDHRGVSINGVSTGEKNSDYGMATLIFATPSNVYIDQKIIDYAKKKNVNIYQRVAIQVTSIGQTYSGQGGEQGAIKNNEMKVSEAFPVYVAPSVNKKIDRSKVDNSGGQGVGDSVNINWQQE